MVVLVWTLLGALSVGLAAVSTWGMAVGSVARLSGEQLQRCPRCGGHGLAQRGQIRPDGCRQPRQR